MNASSMTVTSKINWKKDWCGSMACFSDHAIFHMSSKVNCHSVCISGSKSPHQIRHECICPKVNVFCAILLNSIYNHFYLARKLFSGSIYLDRSINWLMCQLYQNSFDFSFQQDGALHHFHLEMQEHLSSTLLQ